MAKQITIVGGGLAGLTLGISLRRHGIPVAIAEAGSYPRHRVCGEFISGRGQDCLARLGLRATLVAAGASVAQSVAFFSNQRSSGIHRLPEPALCCSRFDLDSILAKEFCRLGGELKEDTRYTDSMEAEGIVRATGRRAESVAKGWRWIGLKVHANQVPLEADLEMHFLPNGYVGLCRLGPNKINICGLFRSSSSLAPLHRPWPDQLQGSPNSTLSRRFANAVFDESSFCSVAGLGFKPKISTSESECRIGDALGMIAPMTGNGMSIAFESAELAVEPLCEYSLGNLPWATTRARIVTRFENTFRRRMRIASWLHVMAFHAELRSTMPVLLRWQPWLFRWFFVRTRQP